MDTFAALYVSLRNAVLGPHDTSVHGVPAHRGVGHFLTNGRYPVNMLQESSDLFDPAAPPAAGTPLAEGDNPLLNTGKLLIALAIESDVGSPIVTQWIDGALSSLRSLFPFSGPFAGYPLRRDPVSSHDWSDQPVGWPMFPPPARYSANFLLDDAGQYQLLAPAHDWRRSRRIGPAEAAGLSSYALRAWGRRHKQDDMDRLRDMEPSSDELVGLITGLHVTVGGNGHAGPLLPGIGIGALQRVRATDPDGAAARGRDRIQARARPQGDQDDLRQVRVRGEPDPLGHAHSDRAPDAAGGRDQVPAAAADVRRGGRPE